MRAMLVVGGVMWTDGRRFLSLAVSLSDYLESRRSDRLDEEIDRMLSEQPETA